MASETILTMVGNLTSECLVVVGFGGENGMIYTSPGGAPTPPRD